MKNKLWTVAIIALIGCIAAGCNKTAAGKKSPTGIEMVNVPGGSFEMGKDLGADAFEDQTPVHKVTLSGFKMSKYEVTQAQYQAVMENNPSYFDGEQGREPTAGEIQENRPVEQVSWYDAIVFCNKLSIKEGLTPAYRISGSTNPSDWGTVPTDDNDSAWDAVEIINANGYRLPTEAQWEYAAKGGNGSPGSYTYSGSNAAGDVAWHDRNSNDMTHEAGKLAANGLGLYDMSGNVFEWCWDWYDSYTSEAQTDPASEASSITDRVDRGGSYGLSDEITRSVFRDGIYPAYRNRSIGFRLVRP